MDSDAGGLFDDAGADLEQPQPEGGELRPGERTGGRDGIAKAQHQPVGSGMEDEAHLVGNRALAGGAVGGERGPHLLLLSYSGPWVSLPKPAGLLAKD